jgi:hypothetical protein
MAKKGILADFSKSVSAFGQTGTPEEKEEGRAKALCEERGGTWDPIAKACRMPDQTPKPPVQTPVDEPQAPKVTLTTPEIIRDEETGKISGVRLSNGKTFLGLSPEEVNAMVSKSQEGTQLPEGTQPAGTARKQAENQQQIQRLTQLAQQGLLTQDELQTITGSKLDVGQVLGAGVTGVVPGIIGGAVAGGVAGAVVGGVGAIPGAVGGAIIGGIGTFLSSIRGNIKSQQVGEFSADQTALSKGERYLRSLITDTNQNPQNAPENIAMFYHTLNMIDAAHAKTWKDSQEDINKFLGNDGTPQLAKFDTFDATMRNYYINRFEVALLQPNPNEILITNEDLDLEMEE